MTSDSKNIRNLEYLKILTIGLTIAIVGFMVCSGKISYQKSLYLLLTALLILGLHFKLTSAINKLKIKTSERIVLGKEIKLRIHSATGIVLGLCFLFADIFTAGIWFEKFGIGAILGIIMILQNVSNIFGYYITLTKSQIIKENLIIWSFRNISHYEKRDSKVILTIKGKTKYIFMNLLTEYEQERLLLELDKRVTKSHNA